MSDFEIKLNQCSAQSGMFFSANHLSPTAS
uniref:Uncharacterized protein n=1 Tax=Candidatus Kentrum sp. FM TaxID=2126340 RepID=A0A450WG21_9GAMM|nr:MAG: hypothetical protein BECKFM1743C_GA0114222_104106 [Candidatus Kentron sp. FM]VFJ66148.1 MAG: hypothetical protein BECKFM1743A_GA0114220_104036 [Candidatus Kentron sp. FM]VFK16000.1 MAG: hypothetical protein BECKFM1743B_GA0114221_103976 [Candidatus Kentron sp. FM]